MQVVFSYSGAARMARVKVEIIPAVRCSVVDRPRHRPALRTPGKTTALITTNTGSARMKVVFSSIAVRMAAIIIKINPTDAGVVSGVDRLRRRPPGKTRTNGESIRVALV